MSRTVAILPGIVSGPRTTSRLRKLLRQAGYDIVDATADADVVLAHSAGCLWLPQTGVRKQLLILVNPPYWPGKTVRERIRTRSHSNFRFYAYDVPLRAWLTRQWWGLYYAVRNPRRTWYVLQHMADYNLEQTVRGGEHIVVVRNRYDDWLTSDLDALQQFNPNLTLIHLPGEHDDFNYHPERYADLLQSLL